MEAGILVVSWVVARISSARAAEVGVGEIVEAAFLLPVRVAGPSLCTFTSPLPLPTDGEAGLGAKSSLLLALTFAFAH